MNKKLEAYARNSLIKNLVKLPEEKQLLFKRMYSYRDLEKSIPDIVNDMHVENLDWAMMQVAGKTLNEC